jgi:hypothetical protein
MLSVEIPRHIWGRELASIIERGRGVNNVVETKRHIKVKMIDNMDDHFNAENCPVCLDSYNSSKKICVTMECRHIVCSGCMIEIVKKKITTALVVASHFKN